MSYRQVAEHKAYYSTKVIQAVILYILTKGSISTSTICKTETLTLTTYVLYLLKIEEQQIYSATRSVKTILKRKTVVVLTVHLAVGLLFFSFESPSSLKFYSSILVTLWEQINTNIFYFSKDRRFSKDFNSCFSSFIKLFSEIENGT